MHPPQFHLDHRLSDWPECRLEVRCPGCKRVAYVPMRLLKAERGDRTFRLLLKALRCGGCGCEPGPVYLLAEQHREHSYGSSPGWAIELVRKP